MANTITGKITDILPLQKGQSPKGAWKHQEFVIETADGQYNSRAHFSVWGDERTAALAAFRVGDTVEVSFDYFSREYNGRWYDEGRAWRLVRAEQAPAAPSDDASFSPDLP